VQFINATTKLLLQHVVVVVVAVAVSVDVFNHNMAVWSVGAGLLLAIAIGVISGVVIGFILLVFIFTCRRRSVSTCLLLQRSSQTPT